MNSQIKPMNTESRPRSSTMNSEDILSFTTPVGDAMAKSPEKRTISKQGWKLKSNSGLPDTGSFMKKLEPDRATKEETKKNTESIGKDLNSITNSLDETDPKRRSSQEEHSEPAFGPAMLRQTAHGKDLKEGAEIRSRKYRRARDLNELMKRKAAQATEAALETASEESPVTMETKEDEVQKQVESVEAPVDVDREASQRNTSVLAHEKAEPIPAPSPTPTRRPPTRQFNGESPLAMLHPTGPGKALREGTEPRRRFLRLVELSELLTDWKQKSEEEDEAQLQDSFRTIECEKPDPLFSVPIESPMPTSRQGLAPATPVKFRGNLGVGATPTGANGSYGVLYQRAEDEEESYSSDDTSISSDSSSASFPDCRFDGGDSGGLASTKRFSLHFTRPQAMRGMSFDCPIDPPPLGDRSSADACESVNSADDSQSPSFNNLRPSYVRGLSFESQHEPSVPQRNTVLPAPSGISQCQQRNTVLPAPSGISECQQRNTVLPAPSGIPPSSEGVRVRRTRRGGRRHRRMKQHSSLKDASSDDEGAVCDLRDTLQPQSKVFRRIRPAYSLPQKKEDIKRKITRKRSVRPKIRFLKVLPRMRPTVKALLYPPEDTTDESDASSRSDVSTTRRRSSWVPPAPTPSRKNESGTLWTKPDWAEAHLKPTGQKEKIKTVGNLAKPITFPVKEESSAPGYSRAVLRKTDLGQTIQNGGTIRSRRTRRLQELSKMGKHSLAFSNASTNQ